VLIDDNKENINRLSELIDNIYDVEIIAHFDSAEKFLKAAKSLRFDLCIVDYHLPNMSGIECAKRLPNKNIILTSHQPIPAHEAMLLDDITDVFLLDEHFDLKRLEKSVKRVRDQISSEKGFVIIKTKNDSYRQIQLNEILFIKKLEDNSRYKQIVTIHEEIITKQYTTEEILNKLPDDLFFRISETVIMHINSFHSMGKDDYVNLKNPHLFTTVNNKKQYSEKESFPLSRKYKEDFQNRLGID
jgi:DNA-binding LytR/AlgR family response regulator